MRHYYDQVKIVILGVGWAGFRLARDIDCRKFDVTLVSPRNHFLFTPLLPSTTVGTLEFRCVQEPARTLRGVRYYQASAQHIDFNAKSIQCRTVYSHYEIGRNIDFSLKYDKLVIAVGSKSNTFGVSGLESREEDLEVLSTSGTSKHNVFFLKQLQHARSIRNRIIECFERASSPFLNPDERKRLLTFVIVGGGPTAIEFTSELCDFLQYDVGLWFKDLRSDYRVMVIEAGTHILGTFDASLSEYVEKLFKSRNVAVRAQETVSTIKSVSVVLRSGEEIPFGVCVWSTGNTALDFVHNLKSDIKLSKDGRIHIDHNLAVIFKSTERQTEDVFALGDCAVNIDRPLAMVAQVANQQAIHLAKQFNSSVDGAIFQPFEFKFMGVMAQLGTFKAVADLDGPKLRGFLAFLLWRSAYWTMSVSVANKILIPMYWFKSYFFGRDISKF